MTGRGDGRLFRPSRNPVVTLGISISASSNTLDHTSPSPFFIIVSVRSLTTPRLDSPITLATHLTALDDLSNRSFHNIYCIHPSAQKESGKKIEIFPSSWPHYIWDSNDLQDSWNFVTIPPSSENQHWETKHQVDPKTISEAGLQPGERYHISLTNKCLGTRWWAFGSLDELSKDGTKFRQWGYREPSTSFKGEQPDDLALVVENGTAEFEVV